MNPRHPAPKRRRERFSIGKQTFPAPSVPVKILSGALVSTVSARSGSRYGRRCGHKQNRSRKPFDRGGRERLYVTSVERESQVVFQDRIMNWCVAGLITYSSGSAVSSVLSSELVDSV